MRWSEEVELLQEEMRRTKEYFAWHARWWERHAAPCDQRPDFMEGVRAYALRQASIRRRMRDWCANAWRYVSAWVCLGQAISDDGQADTASDLPSLQTITASSSESLGALEEDMEDIADVELAMEDFD